MSFSRIISILLLSAAGALAAANPPSNVAAAATSCTSVTVTWSPASGSGNSAPSQYLVYRDNTSTQIGTVSASTTSFADANAGSYSTHIYGVATKTAGGSVSSVVWSSTAPTANKCAALAGPPGKVSIGVQNDRSVLSWPGSSGVKYQVECSSDFGSNWFPVDAPTTSMSVTNVRVGPAVIYRVAWLTNTVEYRNNYALYSSDVTAPATPNVTATDLTGSKVSLSWTPSTDSQSGVKGYLIYRDNSFLAFTPEGTTSYTDATGAGLNSDYSVAVLDRAGNTSSKGPSTCTYSISSGSWSAPTCGGSTTINVSASRSRCAWSVSNPCGTWLTVSPTSGSGNGAVSISAASNTSGSTRSCTLTIAGQSFTVTQGTCGAANYSITTTASPSAGGYTSGGGTYASGAFVTVSASTYSGYTFANWTENGNVVSTSPNYSFTVTGNRTLVANYTQVCNFTITTSVTPTAGGYTTGGGTVACNSSVTVSATAYSGYSFASWKDGATVVSTSPTYTFTATANRTLTANFTQICSYSVTPNSSSFGTAGGSGSSIVYVNSGCAWTASTAAGWITITSGSSGNGNGTVYYSVTANTSTNARSATISITGGISITINQDGAVACSYSLTPTNVYYSSAIGNGSSIVTAGGGCAWTASTTNSWLTITSGTSGSGGGSIAYSITANSSTASGRVGRITMTAGGQTKIITVNQDPNYVPISRPGSNQSVAVNTSVSMDGSTSTDQDGYIASYQWNFGDGYSGSGATTSHAYSAAGTYYATLTTTDNLGASSSASKTVTVSAASDTTPPSASLSSPTGGATLSGTATFSGSASDNVGVTRVEFWCDGSMLLGTDTTSPYSITFDTTGIPNGTRTFTCKAFDAAGNSTVSSSVNATVSNGTTQTGACVWSARYGGSILQDTTAPMAVAVDKRDSSTVMVGWFMGTANLGVGSLVSASVGSPDIFIAKYGANGTPLWSKRIGGGYDDRALSAAVDPTTGDVVVVGYFQSTSVDFGGGTIAGSGVAQLFVVKYSSNGSLQWVRNIPGSSGSSAKSVAIEGSSGAVIITGYYRGSIDFGQGTMNGPGNEDAFLAKFDSAGNTLWARGIGSSADDEGDALAVDNTGAIVLAGWTTGTLNLTGTPLTSAGNRDVLVAKYSSTGTCVWAKLFGDSDNQTPVSIAVDANGKIAVAGAFLGSVGFAPRPAMVNAGASDVFLAKLDSNGNGLWSTQIGSEITSSPPAAASVAMDGSGNVILTGQVQGAFDFNTFVAGTPDSAQDVYVAKFSDAGAQIWIKRTLGISGDMGQAIATKPNGSVVVAGTFASSLDFGCGALTNPIFMNAAFLAELAP